jgi:hypothetical protein
MKDPKEFTSAKQFETTLKETFSSYWRAVQIDNTKLFSRDPKTHLGDTTLSLAGKSTNFINSLSSVVEPLSETILPGALKMATLVEQGAGLLQDMPVIKNIVNKIPIKHAQKNEYPNEKEMLDNFKNSFSDSKDAKQTIEKIAKTIVSIYADQFKKMNVEDAKVLAEYTNLLIINSMQLGNLVNRDDKVKTVDDKVKIVIDWLFYSSMYHYDKKDRKLSPKISLQQETGETKLVMFDFYGGPGLKCLNEKNEEVRFNRRADKDEDKNSTTRPDIWGYRLASPDEVWAYKDEIFAKKAANTESSGKGGLFIPVSPTLEGFDENTRLLPIIAKIEDDEPKLGQDVTLDTQVRNEVKEIAAYVDHLSQETHNMQKKINTNMENENIKSQKQSAFNAMLGTQVENLKSQFRGMDKTIARLQDQILDLKKEVTGVRKENLALASDNQTLKEKNRVLENQVGELTKMKEEHLALKDEVSKLKEMFQLLQSQQVNNTVNLNNKEPNISVQNKGEATPQALNKGTSRDLLSKFSSLFGKSVENNRNEENITNNSPKASGGESIEKKTT